MNRLPVPTELKRSPSVPWITKQSVRPTPPRYRPSPHTSRSKRLRNKYTHGNFRSCSSGPGQSTTMAQKKPALCSPSVSKRAPWPVALPLAGPPAMGLPYWPSPPNPMSRRFSANGATTPSRWGLSCSIRMAASSRPCTTTRPVWLPEPVPESRLGAFTMLGGAVSFTGSNSPIDQRRPRNTVGNRAAALAARARCQRKWNGPMPGSGEAPARSITSSSPCLWISTGRRTSPSSMPMVSKNTTDR